MLCAEEVDREGMWGSLKARLGVNKGWICRSTKLLLAVSQLLSPVLFAPTQAMRAVWVLLLGAEAVGAAV